MNWDQLVEGQKNIELTITTLKKVLENIEMSMRQRQQKYIQVLGQQQASDAAALERISTALMPLVSSLSTNQENSK